MYVVDGRKVLHDLNSVAFILTYPSNFYDEHRVRRLKNLGIEGIYDYGNVVIGNLRVLGKGHSSIVVLAKHRVFGDVALKVRRVDSKRNSLMSEGHLMSLVKYDVVPRVYYYDDDLIIMEYLDGVLLGEYLKHSASLEDVRKVFIKVFEASYKLDLSNVDHLELANPYRHTMVLRDSNVKFLDFESARFSIKSCNLCRVFSAFIRFVGLHKTSYPDLSDVRSMLREYKLGRRELYEEIVARVSAMY